MLPQTRTEEGEKNRLLKNRVEAVCGENGDPGCCGRAKALPTPGQSQMNLKRVVDESR